MKIMRYLVGGAVLLWPMLASAAPLYLSGTIGHSPVLVMVERRGTEISGWYLYLRHGKEIRLDGKIDAAGNFAMKETLYPSSTITGTFKGVVHGGQWIGTWQNPTGDAPEAVALTENRDRLAGVSGHFACTGRRVDGELGYTFTQSLDLTLARGTVTKLAVSHVAHVNGDEQMCGIALSDLTRAPSSTGVLLRAKGDAPGTEGGHCSVHIVATGDYLYLQMGDFTEDGNDCRSSGDEMYCSPRGNWNDLILNRKTGTCTMVQ